jgi:mono/diheme cytochrome c family protein
MIGVVGGTQVRSLYVFIGLGSLAIPLAGLAARQAPVPAARPAPARVAESATVAGFLAQHCFACHGPKNPASGVDLTAYRKAGAVARDPQHWETVLLKLRTGEMPPKGSPRPKPEDVKRVSAAIEGELRRAEAAAKPDPGRVTARRLNRAEYNNTVRDLLGIDPRPADDFPQDDSGYGFDNIGDVLSLSPVLLERYLDAAERVTREALFGAPQLKPTLSRRHPAELVIPPVTEVSADYDRDGVSQPNALHGIFRIPVDGEYTVRIVLGGSRPLGSEPTRVGIWADGKQVSSVVVDPEETASFSLDEQNFSGKDARARVQLKAGDRWIAASILAMYEGLPPEYGGPNPSRRKAVYPPAPTPPANATAEELREFAERAEARKVKRAKRQPVNLVRLRIVEIAGPYSQVKGPSERSLGMIYTCGHLHGGHAPGCERRIVTDFARRAFRRPVTRAEVDRYTRLVSQATQQGDPFEEGLAVALQAILVSPHFLFRIEPAPAAKPGTPVPVPPHALASRLSYFLWSTMPDEELLRLADSGALSRPQVVEAQVRRMLKDPKASALVENFGGQWLELRKLEAAKPDVQRYPEFDEYLRLSMRRETELFLAHMLREDRPIDELIDAPYSYLNERLARFYGIPGVRGTEFRKVPLAGTRRGGLLTQASVLTVSSYSTRTSPVLRGRWILENVLNAAPPPPPPGVPNLDEAKVGESVSLRKQLELHRANPTCASCHSRMDPLGFSLENFDAIGAWRTMDGKQPIDSSASLPDGRTLRGADELKAVIKEDRKALAGCLTEKLLTYALGRGLEPYDRRTVNSITNRLSGKGYRFTALIQEIAGSLPFRMRR